MSGGTTPPTAPNVNQVAQTQQQYNQQAQQGSAVSQSNPYGSLTYTTGPDGQLTANQSLSTAQQGLLDTLQGTQQQAGTAGQNLLASANYGSGVPDLSTDTNSIVNQNLQNYTSYLDPYFSQQNNQLDNQLRNQGLTPGTPAYTNAMNNLSQSQNQSVSGYLAQMEPQAFNQAVSTYQLPYQMSSALAQLGAPSNYGSQNASTPTQNPVDYTGLTEQNYQSQLAQYNAQVQQNSGLFSGLAGIGGSVLGGPIGGAIGSSVGSLFGSPATTTGWTPTITTG